VAFRNAELNVTECTSCGAPVDKRSAVLSRASGKMICKRCEGGELVADRAPPEGLSWSAMAASVFGAGCFVGFKLQPSPAVCAAGAALGLVGVVLGVRARGKSASRLAAAAVAIGVAAIVASVFAFIGASSRPRI
jgi:hypothetical protein